MQLQESASVVSCSLCPFPRERESESLDNRVVKQEQHFPGVKKHVLVKVQRVPSIHRGDTTLVKLFRVQSPFRCFEYLRSISVRLDDNLSQALMLLNLPDFP